MLTKIDLQLIGSVVDEKLDIKLAPVKKDLTDVKKRVRKIEKTVDLITKNYDEGDTKLSRRVTKIEEHLQI